ncbi:MAG TPA: serine hydrolase [Labilithrix sp.]
MRSSCLLLLLAACSSSSSGDGPAPAPTDAPPDAPNAPPPPPSDLPTKDDLAPLVAPLVDGGWIDGVAIGLVDPSGTAVYGFGPGAPDGDTELEIGSLTKAMTGLWLVTEPGVSIDDDVQKYLPASVTVPTRSGKSITLGELAAHTSGLPRVPTNLAPADPDDPYADYTVQDLYAFLNAYSLPRDPGASWEYSNVGVGLLGHALTLHAGGTYEQGVTTRVLAPLGMKDTAETLSSAQRARLAKPHDGDLQPAEEWHATNAIEASGQLHSTPNDMLRWAAAAAGIGADALQSAIGVTQASHAKDDIGRAQGFGWVIESDGSLWHNGGTGGFSTYLGVDRKKHVGVVVLANTECLKTTDLGAAILATLRGTKVVRPQLPKAIALTDDQLGAFVGSYAFAKYTMTVTLKDHALWATSFASAPARLYPEAASSFTLRVVDGTIAFDATSATVSLSGASAETGTKK